METKKVRDIYCPACNALISNSFTVEEVNDIKTDWMWCVCGCIFHKNGVKREVFNEDYKKQISEFKMVEDRYKLISRTYAPIVEELTYGRKFLDVGFTLPYLIEDMKERGWVSEGIDLIKNDYITGDFEEHKFTEKYDFIFMGHVSASFNNPLKALYKAHEMLKPSGVLMVMGIDAEAVWLSGMSAFGHWQSKEKWLFFSERQFIKVIERLGYEVILRKKNFVKRWLAWNTYHVICQKSHISEDKKQ